LLLNRITHHKKLEFSIVQVINEPHSIQFT